MKVAVIGASDNPQRYAYLAARALTSRGHEVHLYGLRAGEVDGQQIITDKQALEPVDTVTLYVGPRNLPYWKPLIAALNPKRIIFNPGTEDYESMGEYQNKGIQVIQGCTLVMLSSRTF